MIAWFYTLCGWHTAGYRQGPYICMMGFADDWRTSYNNSLQNHNLKSAWGYFVVVVYNHVLSWFWCLNKLCIKSFVHIPLSYHLQVTSYTDTCDPIIMYCLGLFTVNNVVYKQISMTSLFWWQIAIYILTKLHYSIIFSFWVTLWRRRRRRRWTKLPIIAPYIMMLGTMPIPISERR